MFDFDITIAMPTDTSGTVTVTVTGEVDVCAASRLEHAIVAVVLGDVRTCIVDLTGVVFLDSSGISALVTARHRLNAEGVTLRTRTGQGVHEVFELAGVVDYLAATCDGVEELRSPASCQPSKAGNAPQAG